MNGDRIEQAASNLRAENAAADLGDLTQLMPRGQEAKQENSLNTMIDGVMEMTKSYSTAIKALTHTEAGRELLDTIHYMAGQGEPLYMYLRDQLER